MTDTDSTAAAPRALPPYGFDEHQAEALARLTDRYQSDLPGIRTRVVTSVPAVLHAACGHQSDRMFKGSALFKDTLEPLGLAGDLEDRAEDVADALSLLRVARADLDGLESSLLLAARSKSARTGKPLLTFKQIAAALAVESEQAAQGRYRRKVGNLSGSDSGQDGTP